MLPQNLSEIWEEAGKPKIFIYGTPNLETLFVDVIWLAESGIPKLLDEDATTNWGYETISAIDNAYLMNHMLRNDTKNLRGRSLPEWKKAGVEQTIQKYKDGKFAKPKVTVLLD
jgi:hypothetical protein